MPRKRIYKTKAEKKEANRLKSARYYARNKEFVNAKRRKSFKFNPPPSSSSRGHIPKVEMVDDDTRYLLRTPPPSSSTSTSSSKHLNTLFPVFDTTYLTHSDELHQKPFSPYSHFERHESPASRYQVQSSMDLHTIRSSPDPLDVICQQNQRTETSSPEKGWKCSVKASETSQGRERVETSCEVPWKDELEACVKALRECYHSVGAPKRSEFLSMALDRHLESIRDHNYHDLLYDKHDILADIELRIIRLHERVYFRLPHDLERGISRLRDRTTDLRTNLGSMALTGLRSTEDLVEDFANGLFRPLQIS
ncbi:hypothetical protein VNI00_013005 [Paramarasmius palmivorus]|uniref:Uncharacterized protein n=1 Tax=Paramarasmius palmivorus TaxID=297713 RepID=A0AAW0C140_9AGAR